MASGIEKLDLLEKEKKIVLQKIKDLDTIFEEEKDNEEAWPGHASTRYQTADIDHQVLVEHLKSINSAIEMLLINLKNTNLISNG